MTSLQKQFGLLNRARFALAVSVGVGTLAFYFLDYRPFTGRILRAQATISEHQVQLHANQVKASDRNKIAANNERMRVELDQFRKPSKATEFPQLLKDLDLFKQQASLKGDIKPGNLRPMDIFVERPLVLTMEGDFVNVFDFLRSAEQMQRLTRVRSMTIKRKIGRSGTVQAEVAMNIYFAAE